MLKAMWMRHLVGELEVEAYEVKPLLEPSDLCY